MKVALLSREFPPEVYGGAGVHVEYLSRELSALVDLSVHCFGAPRQSTLVAGTYHPWAAIVTHGGHGSALGAMSVNLLMAAAVEHADLVHSHTWYTNLGGHLAKLLYDIPHVVTSHSLEPLRPWKAEQLGGGYALSLFCERTALEGADAVIAVSEGMRADVLRTYPGIDPGRVEVIHNGIDPDEYRPDTGTDALERLGVDPARPSVVFVGRLTRQKGVAHLLDAGAHIDPTAQLVLCAGAPDTVALGDEMRDGARRLQEGRGGVVWVEEMLPRRAVIQVLTHATVFVCPSVYEPFGLINLEAMACEAPVVASAVGGIPEVVVHGETGYLVPFEPGADGAPRDPDGFARDLAVRVNELLAHPALAHRFGQAGRRRVLEHFSWQTIARRTQMLYQRVVRGLGPRRGDYMTA